MDIYYAALLNKSDTFLRDKLTRTNPGSQNNLHHFSHMKSWWRHQMETFSALLALYAGNSLVTGDPPPPQKKKIIIITIIIIIIIIMSYFASSIRVCHCQHYSFVWYKFTWRSQSQKLMSWFWFLCLFCYTTTKRLTTTVDTLYDVAWDNSWTETN